MKKTVKEILFSRKTIITAAILIAVFISVFFLFFGLRQTPPTLQEVNQNETSSVLFSDADSSSSSLESEISEVASLVISSPAKNDITVTDSSFSVYGSCDPSLPLYINGKEVAVTNEGEFSEDISLSVGKNTLTFVQGDTTVTKTVTYRYVIIKDYSPASAKSYTSGSNIVVSVTARRGSTVTATLDGKSVTLSANKEAEGDFIPYYGMFSLPKDNLKELKIGKIKFTGKLGSSSENFYSGDITVKKTSAVSSSDPNATPSGGNYINVGSGYIAEIVQFHAETFDGKFTATNADWSRPTNSYLPKGTVDYCSTGLVYDSSGERSYVTLRCGKRIYYERTDSVTQKTSKVVKRYVGTLPDHNELSVAAFNTEKSHTYLTLNTDWKAPFTVLLSPQNYVNPTWQDYRIESATFSYLDITFCYATVFEGEIEIDPDHPLFKKAEVIKKKSECVLRLHLKKAGSFYGWDAGYNDKGQLCFSFLNPAYTKEADNEYGRDLSGITVFVDAGHGGKDVGALGISPKKFTESTVNLKLAKLVEAELKKMGATVVLSRTDDRDLSADDRQKLLKNLAPDLCVSIHHDANNSSKLNGFGSFYNNAFSKKAAEYVYNRTIATGLYNSKSNNKNRLDWHYFFLARMTTCPVVLTENGYMTNSSDFAIISSSAKLKTKAKAIAQGVADYFEAICPEKPFAETPDEIPDETPDETPESSEIPETPSTDDSLEASVPDFWVPEESSKDESVTTSDNPI